MESIGERLRSAREAKKLTIKQVVKETNITHLYVEALEDEEFDKFPSETYLIGFLRSYAEYLKLDTDEIIQAYKGYKIGESATPLEELTKPTAPSFTMMFQSLFLKYKNIIFVAVIAVVAFVIFIGFHELFTKHSVSNKNSISVTDIKNKFKNNKKFKIRNLSLMNNKGFDLIYNNEAVQFLVDSKEVVFILKEIKKDNVTIQFYPDKSKKELKLNKPETFQKRDWPRDVTFQLKGLTKNRAKIMISLGKKDKKIEKKDKKIDSKKEYTSVVAMDKRNLKIVFEANFVQKCFVEIYLDGSKKRPGFIPSGSHRRWEANEIIQVKLGNAGGIQGKINGKAFTFGGVGQVANKVITWKKDTQNPNLYHIVLKDGS